MIDNQNPEPGNRFARNAIIFTIVICLLIVGAYFYRYLMPENQIDAGVIPSQPASTLVPEQPPLPSQ